MARLARVELFDPSEIAIVHTIGKVVQGSYLLGDDPLTGKNFDHRKAWIEEYLRQFAAHFGVDLLGFVILISRRDLPTTSRSPIIVSRCRHALNLRASAPP